MGMRTSSYATAVPILQAKESGVGACGAQLEKVAFVDCDPYILGR
jgi:hypothetical protein